MEETSTIDKENTCSQCGRLLATPEQCLAMDGDHALCTQCYRCLLMPGCHAAHLENLD